MARIDDFRANFVGGGARPSQFRVQINFPVGIAIPSAGLAVIQQPFMIKAASLPSSTISTIEIPFRGRIAKVAGERQFQSWNISVLNDNKMTLRNAFEEWSTAILNHKQTNGVLAPTAYQVDALVYQMDRNDKKVKTYKFHGVYPESIGDISLNFGDSNSVEEFNVSLSVDYWTTESTEFNAATTDQ